MLTFMGSSSETMNQIEFPIIRINSKSWKDHEDLMPLFDGYIYTSSDEVYYDYLHEKDYTDCKGDIYKVTGRVFPVSFWRRLFRFLPNVYKVRLTFIKTERHIELEEFKIDLIAGIRRFDTEDTIEISNKWIAEIQKSQSIKEILIGESDL